MKQTKLTYLSPVTETLVIQSEGTLCVNSPLLIYGAIGAAGGDVEAGNEYDL